jgi:hypothetical protein
VLSGVRDVTVSDAFRLPAGDLWQYARAVVYATAPVP